MQGDVGPVGHQGLQGIKGIQGDKGEKVTCFPICELLIRHFWYALYWFIALGSLKGSPGFGIPGQPGPKGESGERVCIIKPVF